jgi:kynurenine formamidase
MSKLATQFLSYTIDETTPAYGGGKGYVKRHIKDISNGDSCNTIEFTMPNHLGTHIDFPKHFSVAGKTLNDYEADFWIFKKAKVIDIVPSEDLLINEKRLHLDSLEKDIELLFLRSGFESLRNSDTYFMKNPGLHSSLAKVFRERFPRLKAVGMDFISISSFKHRDEGRLAHKVFLLDADILLIEDVKLSVMASNKVYQVVGLPLMLAEADGVPITLIATEL